MPISRKLRAFTHGNRGRMIPGYKGRVDENSAEGPGVSDGVPGVNSASRMQHSTMRTNPAT
jgi:hypothetical protein